jgi:hypothetical protein
MPKLSYKRRKGMRSSSFALEKERKYPIDTIGRARNALARVATFGTPAEKYEVRHEVFAKYPSLKDGRAYQDFLKQKKARSK